MYFPLGNGTLCRCFEVFHPSPVSSKCEFPFHYVPFSSLHCSGSLWLCSALLSRNASLCSRLWSTERWPFTSLFFWSFHTLLPLYQNRDLSLNSSMEPFLLCLFSFICCNFPNHKNTKPDYCEQRWDRCKECWISYYQCSSSFIVHHKNSNSFIIYSHSYYSKPAWFSLLPST